MRFAPAGFFLFALLLSAWRRKRDFLLGCPALLALRSAMLALTRFARVESLSGTPRIIYQPVCRHWSIGNTLAALPPRRTGLFRTLFQSQNRQNDAENYY